MHQVEYYHPINRETVLIGHVSEIPLRKISYHSPHGKPVKSKHLPLCACDPIYRHVRLKFSNGITQMK